MVSELVDKYGLPDAAPKRVPLSPTTQLTRDGSTPLDTSAHTYSALVGSLLYLSVCTRPDIAQAVGALAKYMAAPTEAHWTTAKGVLRYLKGTANLGISALRRVQPHRQQDNVRCGALLRRRLRRGRRHAPVHHRLRVPPQRRSHQLEQPAPGHRRRLHHRGGVHGRAPPAKEAAWLRKLLGDLGMDVSTQSRFWPITYPPSSSRQQPCHLGTVQAHRRVVPLRARAHGTRGGRVRVHLHWTRWSPISSPRR